MRKALGLGGGSGHSTPQQRPEQARARHRFVQDGGVPVVMLSQKAEPESAALRERIGTLEHQLESERAAHGATRRQLESEHQAVTALQTRIAHNDLAHKDALEQERRLRDAAQSALQEALAALQEAQAPVRRSRATPAHEPRQAEQRQPDPEAEIETVEPPRDDAPAELAPAALDIAPQEKRGRGRPRSTTPPEPKPIRWWTPSYRAQKS